MRIDVLTLFPEMVDAPLSVSMIGIAREKGLLDLHCHDIRSWTADRHRTVDDEPFGGGPGMVMKPEPLTEAIEGVRSMDRREPYIVIMTPVGRVFDQAIAEEYSALDRLLLVCGRYEGIDERVFELADDRISIGDYVLTGGELAAMVVVDAIVRLVPGVLGHENSTTEDSFAGHLLEYPQYTRPAAFRGRDVPEILRSGDHVRIAAWRREQSLRRTARFRPDLLSRVELSADDQEIVDDELGRSTRD